ncbi:hypothetical protein HN803_05020 [candidate division WWE3 bacterium]|nr:hypothetical protein [candidate division WWE3 bacterium]
MESNECSPTLAMLRAQEYITWGIEYILKNTELNEIIIPCCYGNHGRTTQRRRVSTGYSNSFEWAMYKNLEKIYEDHEQVEFIVATGSHVYLEIFDNYTIRFHHGDDIRYYGGVGGLTIPLNKAIAGWDTVKKADLTVIGHFHQLTDIGNAVVNGSLIGFGPYALSIKAPYEPAQQAFFLIHETHGKTIFSPIQVMVED